MLSETHWIERGHFPCAFAAASLQSMPSKQISLLIFTILTLALTLPLTRAQVTPSGSLQLDSPQEYSLPAGEPMMIQLLLPESRPGSFDLFLRAAPINGDPFQVPLLTLQAGQYQQQCFSAAAEFAGVCRLPTAQLIGVQKVALTLRCLVDCELTVDAYLAAVVRLSPGDSIQLRAHGQSLSEVLHVEAPSGSDPLAVTAVLMNPEESLGVGEEGIELLINVGTDVQDPDEANFKLKGSSLNGGGKGAFLYKTQPGDLIRCLITLKPGVAVRFSVSPVRGNRFQVELGQSYYDYALPGQPKIYSLDLQDLPEEDTLELVFDIYSGRPQFDLSFSESFTPLIDFALTSSAESILLSPETRRRFNESSTLYVRVGAGGTAEYYFYSSVVRQDVTFLQPYLTYFDQVEQITLSNYLLLERHRLDDQQSLLRNYSFKVDIRGGNGSFHFKRCPSLERAPHENPHIDDCLLTSPQDLRGDKFYSAEIQNRHVQSGSLLTIFMEYDVGKCTITQTAGTRHALCAFQLIVAGTSSDPFEFSLQVQRKYGATYLREGKVVKEYIPRDSYAYFVVALSDVEGVQQVNLFLTALSGEVALIVSKEEPLPSLTSQKALSQAGAKCNIVLEGDQLAKELYVAVYAYRFTEVNLGVIVRRKKENGSSHDIPLLEGNPHAYLLNKTQPVASFLITARQQQQITVLVNELAGHVRLTVTDPSGKAITCSDSPRDRLRCSFGTDKAGNYSARVQGEKESPQSRFSISYSSEQSPCFPSSLNQPVFVSLPPAATHCYSFALNREVDLEIALSLSALAVIDKQVVTSVLINDKHFAQAGTHTTLTVANMLEVCPMGTLLGGFVNACRISLRLENKGTTEAHFSLVVEEQDAEIALFDGVGERVRGMGATVGKNFYYHVGTARRLQLFFSTQSLRSHYFLAARFASPAEFIGRGHSDIYLPYVAERDRPPQRIDSRDNYYSAVLGRTGLETVSIDPVAIRQFCPQTDCYLLLSVYREEYENSLEGDEDYYEVEVTQEETVLQLGESRVGVVDKGEVYAYLVEPEDAVVQFALLESGEKQGGCLEAEAATADGKVLRKNELKMALQVGKAEGVQRIYVRGLQDGCSFSISYLSNDIPYRIARLSHPYELQLDAKQMARFIYYHESPSTFKLASLVSAGAATVYIVPLRTEYFTLSSLSRLNLKKYPSSSFDGEFSMLESDSNFCSRCYYYVAVTAEQRFVGQVVFLRLYDPVPLSTNHAFKERLVPLTPLGVENYIFYALTSFNLTLNMLSGRVGVTVVDPEGKVVVNEEIAQKTTYLLRAIDYQEREAVPYYSERARYRIRVSAIKEAEFYIEPTRLQTTERIFEGLPTLLSLDPAHTQTLEFISSQDPNKPLNLMVDIEEEEGEEGAGEAVLTFSLRGEKADGTAVGSEQLMQKITKSDNTYILDLLNTGGRYFVEVHSSKRVRVNIVLVRTSLTHLSPTRNYLFNAPAVYQLSSSFKKVLIEVFNCEGEVSLLGSRDQRDMQDSFTGASPIALQRPNYAGHYVFTSHMPFSSYFLMVRNKQPSQPLQYLISYYYFEDINPYDAIEPNNYGIAAEYDTQGTLRLTVSPPVLLDYHTSNMTVEIVIVEITYSAYVATNRRDLNRGSRCLINGGFVQKKASPSPTITLEKELLSELQADPAATLYATVEAVVSIQFRHDDTEVVANSPKTVTILYQTLEMAAGEVAVRVVVEGSYAYWFTDSVALFVGWMMLPFVLAAAALFYLLKCCLRRLMMRQASMVEEVDILGGNQTVPTEQKIAISENGPLPETGQQMIKESI